MRLDLMFAAALLLAPVPPADSGTPAPECKRRLVDQSYLCARTLAEMRSVRTAIEAYMLDHGPLPPSSSIRSVRALIEPAYIRVAETTDAWGHPFALRVSPDGRSFSIASAGSDGAFDEASWGAPGLLSSSKDDAALSSAPERDREWVIQE